MGFSNIKSITLSTLDQVDEVHRHAVSMCSYGVSEIGTGACERVDGMVNGAGLAAGSTAGSGATGGWHDYAGRD